MGKAFGAAWCLGVLLASGAVRSAEAPKSGAQGSTLTVTVGDLKALEVITPTLARVRELQIGASCQNSMPSTVPLLSTLGDMSGLEVLRLGEEHRSACDIRVRLPATLTRLKKLRVLRIDSALEVVPDFLGDLASLEDLALGFSGLQEVPTFIRRLRRLRSLSLWGNDISDVPGFLAELPVLEEIDLSGNKVHRLPPAFAKAPALRRIKLGDNQLTAAEKSQLQRDFPKITFDFQDTYGPP